MTREPKWIDKRSLLQLHEESLAAFGGKRGIREEGLLDSALARAHNVYLYRPECSLPELAAAYGFGLAKNHALIDGNKRVAFLALGVFLRINGLRLKASQTSAIETVLGVAGGTVDEAALAAWIAAHVV